MYSLGYFWLPYGFLDHTESARNDEGDKIVFSRLRHGTGQPFVEWILMLRFWYRTGTGTTFRIILVLIDRFQDDSEHHRYNDHGIRCPLSALCRWVRGLLLDLLLHQQKKG